MHGKVRFAASKGTVLVTCQLRAQEHLIVPCVMIVEGVLHSSNASEPALALASEFGAIPQGWDGRPVVYNHPQVDGEAASANRPEGWESDVIGMVFNTSLDENNSSLPCELWLDTSRTPQAVLDGLRNGEEFEVSTGLFALAEETSGTFKGQKYSLIWRNIVPDHLAILERGSIGACSIADGCGALRSNSQKFEVYMSSAVQTQGSAANTSKKKNDVLAAGTGAINGGSDCDCNEVPIANKQSFMSMLPKSIQLAVNKFMGKRSATPVIANELSDTGVRDALSAALADMDGYAYSTIEAVFSTYFVFSAMSTGDYEWATFQLDYSVAEGGAIQMGTDPFEVRPETSYVPVVVGSGTAADANLSANSRKDHIVDITKEQLASLATQVAETLKPLMNTPVVIPATGAQAAETKPVAVIDGNPVVIDSIDQLTANATPAFAASVKDAIAYTNAIRTNTVAALVKAGYAEADLSNVALNVLQRMAGTKPSVGVDFTGQAGGAVQANAAAENFTPPTQVFAKA